ncbi:VOC family protein [Actinophytocola oryzae]|uniref:VOC domain-containing protein n=1 Tax=Actinophytocola oryzae TaxID=502181 RepID=A0A4R7UVC2_9PSEU|nr:VOC family protein [Actinophytocola oryzae]TDV38620.1 hypothetical protein CLV71_1265 [Actinophytocola oryzae]
MPVARIAMTTLDCADAVALADFWASLLEGTVIVRNDKVSVVRTDTIMLGTVALPDYTPPTWPGGTTPKHIHLDLAVSDLDEADAEAVRLGATKAGHQPQPDQWRIFLDPAGHPFCLTSNIPF